MIALGNGYYKVNSLGPTCANKNKTGNDHSNSHDSQQGKTRILDGNQLCCEENWLGATWTCKSVKGWIENSRKTIAGSAAVAPQNKYPA